MCGIVGYTGDTDAYANLLAGIKFLEYRGYDSAGIAVGGPGGIQIAKEKGEISVLEKATAPMPGNYGLAHTRWATHGKPAKNNAHPFADCKDQLALVHNGIIENFQELRDGLVARGHLFTSETDSEVVAHLLEEAFKGDALEALRETVAKLEGSYAIVMVHASAPGKVFGARCQSPLVIGLGAGENLLASDVTPLLRHTQKAAYLEDGDLVEITPNTVRIIDAKGQPVERKTHVVEWKVEDAERGGYKHFMLKEIFDVPQAIRDSLLGRVRDQGFSISGQVDRVKLVACGTSYHAALAGKYLMEELARVPANVEFASEYRYTSGGRERPLVVLISQSGETADTLAAAKEAKRRGCTTVAVTNIVGSSLARECHHVVYTRAGPEIGVAATKTWITQIIALALLSLDLGVSTGAITPKEADAWRARLRELPRSVHNVLGMDDEIKTAATHFKDAYSAFFIGRNVGFPTALEGALKLKEISYIHAEGYAAGELKHGPLALLTDKTPVVALAQQDHTYMKMLSNIREVVARDAPVLGIGEEGDLALDKYCDWTLLLPKVDPALSPVTFGVALQLLAYHVADARGCAIDKPRNLAKSVTVE